MKITGERIVPLSATLKLAGIFFVLNTVSMFCYRLPFYVRYGVTLAGAVICIRTVLPNFMGILKSVRGRKK